MNKLKNNSKPLIWFMGLLLTAFVAGCGSDGGSTAQPGTVSVSLTDAPACGFDQVNVTVSKVRVHQSGSADDKAAGWTDITLDPARKINLLDLNDPTQPNFALDNLGETPLPAGHYTQLRLVLVPNGNSVVLSGPPPSTEIPLDTPSGIQSGIKLIHQFTVDSGQRVDLLLDFDACKSIVQTGNGKYKLKPVIKVIPFVLNGIEGFVDKNLLANNVIVSAQVNGEMVRATVPNTETGKFFLAHLTPTSHDVVITADNHATAVISGVPVPSSTSITTVSTGGAPIPVVTSPALEASATHSISGTVTLDPAIDDETVLIATRQALNGGPTVTVKSQVATVKAATVPPGDYEYGLALPTGAPSLGPYATPLPIVFIRQPPEVAGHYTVQASAAGYATKSSLSPVDISGGDATSQDLTLTP
jgi:Domain of unknown function (DUF4382)